MRFIWIWNYKKMIKTNSQCFSILETLAVLLIRCKTLLPQQGLYHPDAPLIHRQSAWTDQTYQITCTKTYRQCCHVCMLSPSNWLPFIPVNQIVSFHLLSLFADKFSIAAFMFDSSTISFTVISIWTPCPQSC